jgi:hypothetical protein
MMYLSRLFVPAFGVVTLFVLVARWLWLGALRRKFFDPLPQCFPYRARRSLVSRNELAFHRALCRAAGARYAIAVKVRLADVIGCPRAAWSMGYGRLIAQKHLDFVLCEPKTLRVVLAIELDDRSHEHPNRRLRDNFVERAMEAAKVPLLRVRAARSYEPAIVERLLLTRWRPGMSGKNARPEESKLGAYISRRLRHTTDLH